MKYLILLIALSILVISCQPVKEKKVVMEDSILYVQPVSKTETGQIKPLQLNGTTIWKGTINAKIPVTVTLIIKDTIVFGNVVYKNSGKPITLLGYRDGRNNITLHEYYKTKDITGVYYGDMKNDSIIAGTWYTGVYDLENEDEGKDFELKLESVQSKEVPVLPENVSGIYGFNYGGENGAYGNMEVEVYGDSVSCVFECAHHGPGFNLAEMRASGRLFGNHVVFKYPGAFDFEEGICQFEVFFMPDGAFVRHFENGINCGFGHNASLHGIYYKVNEKH